MCSANRNPHQVTIKEHLHDFASDYDISLEHTQQTYLSAGKYP